MIGFLALSGLFCALILFVPYSAYAVENTLPAGLYQFNKLEIFKGPIVDKLPTTVEVIQKNEKSCVVYENGQTDKPLSCIFNGDQNNNYVIQIEKGTALLGVNQEPALLSDFQAGDKINVLGWLAADSKTIRAEVVRNLEEKDYHQSLSGTIKEVRSDGFTITLANGGDVFVKTPIAVGAQVTISGVFDKAKNIISNTLSIFIKPNIVLQETPTKEPTPPPAPSVKPSTLFKNLFKMFGIPL